MIKGMTGFGSHQFSRGEIKGIVEIKSLNHRYFDISYYLPIGFASLENRIKQIVTKKISRGKVGVSVKLTQKPSATFMFNKEAVRQYIKYSKTIKKEFGIRNNMTISDLITLPGVIEVRESFVTPEKIWPIIEPSVRKCLTNLVQMRASEGRSLSADIRDKLRRMSLQVKKIKARSKIVVSARKKKLSEEEFTSFLKSSDINEEVSRLSHYIDEIRLLLKTNLSVGKKMDFIAQEMQRETNTIGSKIQDKLISNAVIALKSKIEKIREQSQNIE